MAAVQNKKSSMEESSKEETDSEDESSEEEIEPKLKYERLKNDLIKILQKDCASCIAVDPKFLAIGTHWGMIYIVDYIGFKIKGKEVVAHSTSINMISIDDNGDHIASCSDDGKVMITGLYSAENNQALSFDRPVRAVAINPNFYKQGSGKQFVTGDDKLVMNEKGFLSRHKSTLLHQGEGPIREIKWRGDFIAWANDKGVKVYDTGLKTRITFIPKDDGYRPDMYRCNICWKDDRTFVIGWADDVKVCVIKDKVVVDARGLPPRYVEITHLFKMECFICGIAPIQNDLVVLCYEKMKQTDSPNEVEASTRPHMRIITPKLNGYEELSNEALTVRGYTEFKCSDYHLEFLQEENLFYIVSPRDIIACRLRDADDHITWLLDHDLFVEAMEETQKNKDNLNKHTPKTVGHLYLNYLMEENQFAEAAQLCVKTLGKDKDAWENMVYEFHKFRKLKDIAPFLPRGDPTLAPAIYEMVLNEFLQTDQETFLQMVKEWPQYLYSVKTLIAAAQDYLDRDKNNKTVLQALAELYGNERSFDKALIIFIQLKHTDVFKLIEKHDLFDAVTGRITQLMELDHKQTTDMLMNNMEKLSIDKVVSQFQKTPYYQYLYLDRIFQKDPHLAQKHHGLQVKLYAEYDRPKLLSFLKRSNYYPLQMAMEECEKRDYIPEQVFLLGRMGNQKQALQLITQKLRDVNKAIDFCKENNEEELWDDLIGYSIDKPNFIKGLLNNIGTHVDPIILIKRIQEGMEIPGLRDSLVKILQDYNLQISLQEGCRKILVADSFNLLDRLVKTQKRGLAVSSSQICHTCQQSVISQDLRYASHIIVFYCKHAFHEDCLPLNSLERCPICSTQRRGPGVNGGLKV